MQLLLKNTLTHTHTRTHTPLHCLHEASSLPPSLFRLIAPAPQAWPACQYSVFSNTPVSTVTEVSLREDRWAAPSLALCLSLSPCGRHLYSSTFITRISQNRLGWHRLSLSICSVIQNKLLCVCVCAFVCLPCMSHGLMCVLIGQGWKLSDGWMRMQNFSKTTSYILCVASKAVFVCVCVCVCVCGL